MIKKISTKIKKIIISLFHTYLILSFIRFIGWSIHVKNYPLEFQIGIIITLVSGFYWYYKGYISKIPDDTKHFWLLGDRK